MRIHVRPALLLCSLCTLTGCASIFGGGSTTVDTFGGRALLRYTIHNTPRAWSVADGQLVGGTGAVQSVVIRTGATLADGWVETETDQASDGGLVLRHQGGGDYYLLAIRDDSHYGWANLEMYRAAGGQFERIAGPLDVAFTRGDRKTFRFEARGTTLTAYMDGEPVLRVSDDAYESGGFGLRHDNTHKGPGITSRFDLLRWGSF
jgi:hypothetical protein